MNNKKGFTLTELLAVIVIIGVISMFAWPIVSNVIETNQNAKFDTYSKSMITAAKVYVDSYEEDMFKYEEDIDDIQRNEKGQCYIIKLRDLIEHSYIKDYNDNNTTCISDGSFVKVIRFKGKYTYSTFLACGNKSHVDGYGNLSDDHIQYLYPPLSQAQIDSGEKHYDPSTTRCNLLLSGRIIYYTKSSCNPTYKRVEYNAGGMKWGELCVPHKKYYTFVQWIDTKTGLKVDADTDAEMDTEVEPVWRKNQVQFIYMTTGGSLLADHRADISQSGEYVLKDGSKIMHAADYDGPLTSAGLADYDNPSAINIGKVGYHAVDNAEWKVVNVEQYDYRSNGGAGGWSTVAKKRSTYDDHVVYDAADFCDAYYGDCKVYLAPNWSTTKNKVYVHQHANGGSIVTGNSCKSSAGCNSLSLSSGIIKVNGATNLRTVTHGNNLHANGLYNWNSSNWVNLSKTGYQCKLNEEWFEKTTGTSHPFAQDVNYTFAQLKPYCHQSGNVSMSCNPDYHDCHMTVYANWVLNKINIVYHTNGGTLLSPHMSEFSQSGNVIKRNGSDVSRYFDYGSFLTENGLANYNNPRWINIGRKGYKAVRRAEWNTKADGTGTSYHQADVFAASQLCDASSADCTVHLYVNWTPIKIKVYLNANGGSVIEDASSIVNIDSVSGFIMFNNGTPVSTTLNNTSPEFSGISDFGAYLTKDGNTCSKWTTESNGGGKAFTDTLSYSDLTSICDYNKDCDIILYANY